MILVTGAAGKTGLAVLRALTVKSEPTRALVHNEAQASAASNAGAEQVLAGDLLDPNVWKDSLKGIDRVYLICPNMHPNETEIGRLAISAAESAGVQRFVYHSVLFPQIEAMPHHWQKLRIEEALIESGLDFSILQPASYMQNVIQYLSEIKAKGQYRIPYSPESLFSPIDIEDVGDAAAAVLLESGHSGNSYQLAGPQILNSHDMATQMETILARGVRCSRQPLSEWLEHARGLPAYSRDSLIKMFAYYDLHGFWSKSQAIDQLLGRPPATFALFIRRLEK